jgi:crossover junction endodeoxyribonuclease RusA
MRELTIRVRGLPIPQGSKRLGTHPITKRAMLIDVNGPALRRWRNAVRTAARNTAGPHWKPLSGPVALTAHFWMPRPAVRAGVHYADRKPDLDKLLRAILDALTGVAYDDDSQVVTITAAKTYPPPGGVPGVAITVRALGAQQATLFDSGEELCQQPPAHVTHSPAMSKSPRPVPITGH